MNKLTHKQTGNQTVPCRDSTGRPDIPGPVYSWYLSSFDGHEQLLIGPCGYDCAAWRELGPVDVNELQRDAPSTWQKAILKYKVNAYDYRCKVARVPFTGDLPTSYLLRKLNLQPK